MSVATPELVHLRPGSYNLIGPEQFGVPGLLARESIGPDAPVQALGVIQAVHDSTFEPHTGIGHHPHRGMERLFYILDGAVDHDDALNRIKGRMRTGDLGILTEGVRGMLHSEWNHGDGAARCYILVYPTDPTPPTASFDAIRDESCPRVEPAPGVRVKHVVTPTNAHLLHGDVRVLNDIRFQAGAIATWELGDQEAGLLFLVEGLAEIGVDGSAQQEGGAAHTFLVPPGPGCRRVRVTALAPSRLLHVATGPGSGLRRG